jgi:hypothetical protein
MWKCMETFDSSTIVQVATRTQGAEIYNSDYCEVHHCEATIDFDNRSPFGNWECGSRMDSAFEVWNMCGKLRVMHGA